MKRLQTLCASFGVAFLAAVSPSPAQLTKTAVPAGARRPDRVEAKPGFNTMEAFMKGRAPDRAADAMRREAQKRMDELEAIHGKLRRIAPAPAPAPAPVVAAPPPAVAVNMHVNIDAQAAQYRQQYRPALRAEYQRLLSVCEPTKDQRKLIARDGEKALTAAARKVAEMQLNFRPAGQSSVNGTPRAIIQNGLAAAARAHLSPEQAGRYEAEVVERTADFRRAAVRNLVAKLDQSLFLSPGQRDQLGDALTAAWDDAWCQSPQMFMNDNYIFPQIPDKVVAPALDPAQKKVWAGAQKGQQTYWGDTMFHVMDDTPLEDAGPEEPPPATAAPPRNLAPVAAPVPAR